MTDRRTDRARRKADQLAKIASMPLNRRIMSVLAGVVVAVVAGMLVSFFLEGEVRAVPTLLVALGFGAVLGYQYLWAPSRRP